MHFACGLLGFTFVLAFSHSRDTASTVEHLFSTSNFTTVHPHSRLENTLQGILPTLPDTAQIKRKITSVGLHGSLKDFKLSSLKVQSLSTVMTRNHAKKGSPTLKKASLWKEILYPDIHRNNHEIHHRHHNKRRHFHHNSSKKLSYSNILDTPHVERSYFLFKTSPQHHVSPYKTSVPLANISNLKHSRKDSLKSLNRSTFHHHLDSSNMSVETHLKHYHDKTRPKSISTKELFVKDFPSESPSLSLVHDLIKQKSNKTLEKDISFESHATAEKNLGKNPKPTAINGISSGMDFTLGRVNRLIPRNQIFHKINARHDFDGVNDERPNMIGESKILNYKKISKKTFTSGTSHDLIQNRFDTSTLSKLSYPTITEQMEFEISPHRKVLEERSGEHESIVISHLRQKMPDKTKRGQNCYSVGDLLTVIAVTSLVNLLAGIFATVAFCCVSLRGRCASTVSMTKKNTQSHSTLTQAVPEDEYSGSVGCLEACLPDISYQRHIARDTSSNSRSRWSAFGMSNVFHQLAGSSREEHQRRLNKQGTYRQVKNRNLGMVRRSFSLEDLFVT